MSASPLSHPLVFVYGTLKRGFHNHGLMRQIGAQFVCPGTTVEEFPLVVHGLPYLLDLPGEGYRVDGEIYRVTDDGFALLDRLEQHPRWYRRRVISVKGDGGEAYEAWAYFLLDPDGLELLSPVERYQ